MMFFYDAQIKRFLTQFMRLMSNFAYMDAKGNIIQVPVRYGDMNRQVAQTLTKNSENFVQSAPFIACYIKNMSFARNRLQDPTYVSKINIRERAYDDQGQEYLNTQGANYTVERLMPTPYDLEFSADIWTTNTDQKFQLLEQMLVLFKPSMEIQLNNNYIDWTSLSLVELTNMTFSSRSIPQGLEQDIDIANLTFKSPIWLSTPAKVKKLGIITSIITNVFDDPSGNIENGAYTDSQNIDYFSGRASISVTTTTLGNLGLLVLNNTAKLMRDGESFTRNDIQSPTEYGIAKTIIVNNIPLTNQIGQNVVSLQALKKIPPLGSQIGIGGTNYTIENYSGDLSNLSLTLNNELAVEVLDDTHLFIQLPNASSDNITVPTKGSTDINWNSILDIYPGKFTAGLSQIRLQKPDGNEIIGFMSLSPTDDFSMNISWDNDTIYANTLIDINGLRSNLDGSLPVGFDTVTGVGRVDAIVNPETFNPRKYLQNGTLDWAVVNSRYLILEDINVVPQFGTLDYDGPAAWKNADHTDFQCTANSIIQWNGTTWKIVFNSEQSQPLTYITNSRTGVQYVWDGFQWMKSFEGVYTSGKWRLVL